MKLLMPYVKLIELNPYKRKIFFLRTNDYIIKNLRFQLYFINEKKKTKKRKNFSAKILN